MSAILCFRALKFHELFNNNSMENPFDIIFLSCSLKEKQQCAVERIRKKIKMYYKHIFFMLIYGEKTENNNKFYKFCLF